MSGECGEWVRLEGPLAVGVLQLFEERGIHISGATVEWRRPGEHGATAEFRLVTPPEDEDSDAAAFGAFLERIERDLAQISEEDHRQALMRVMLDAEAIEQAQEENDR